MDEASIIAALRAYWMESWVDPHTASYVWEDEPEPGSMDDPWLLVIIRSAGTERRGVGRRREENRGLVSVTVQSPKAVGPGLGERLARDVAAVWRAFRHTHIKLDAPSVAGLDPDGAFNRHLITLGWRGDMRFA